MPHTAPCLVLRERAFLCFGICPCCGLCLHVASELPHGLVCAAGLGRRCVRARPSCPPAFRAGLLALCPELLAELRTGPRAASQLWSLGRRGGTQLPGQPASFLARNEVFKPGEHDCRVPVPSARAFGMGLRHPRVGVPEGLFSSSAFQWVLVSSAVGLLGSCPGFASQAWVAPVVEVVSWVSSSRH